jgi:hypothetical protein
MALSNFQYLWNGLTFGAGTDIQVVKEEGLRSIPAIRSQDIAKPRMDGAFAGFMYLGERIPVITLAITVTKNDSFENVVAAVQSAFQPNYDPLAEQWLQFQYPGWSAPRQVKGRVTKAGFPTDLNYSFHKISALPVEFTCSDPVIYDSILQTVQVHLAQSGSFPITTLTANASIGATSLTVANNAGFVIGETIYVDATNTEQRIVSGLTGTTGITISVGLSSAHTSGAAVSGATFPVNLVLTSLSSNVSAGGTALTVASNAGFYAGQTIWLDGANLEQRTVASVSGSTTINLTSGVTAAHTSGAAVWNGFQPPPTSGGALLVNNVGNYKSFPVFTLVGPLTNPTITLASTGEYFTVNTTLSSSDTLVIDMFAGTVILNGTATRYGNVAVGSTWFGIPPGAQSVSVSSTDSTYVAGTYQIDMRSAWSWT